MKLDENELEESEEAEPIHRLSRDLLEAAGRLSREEVRYIVDGYYQMQEYRKASASQVRAAEGAGEPARLLSWLVDQASAIEGQIKRAMQQWTQEQRAGRWAMDQKGIGPVLAAGLLAHIDIHKAPTVGHIWRFAGLDPTSTWAAGEKRPWNAQLKVLCWKVGDSFVKVSGREDAVYGILYRMRKEQEVARNEDLLFEDQAKAALSRKLTAGQREHYAAGKLPPGRIDLRARRYAVKLFLAHLHHVLYEAEYGSPPPRPYVVEHLGHAHYLGPPGWPRD